MCAAQNIVFLLCLQATVILSALPPIDKCSLSDSDCLQKSAQNALTVFAQGIPEVGSEVLEPAHVDVINIDIAGLKVTVTDADIKGLGKSTIDKVKFDSKKKVLELSFHVEPIHFKSKYKAAGGLLNLPINANGVLTINIKNFVVHMTMPYEITKNAEGKDVIEVKSYKFTSENKVLNTHNTPFMLTNLFNENKELSDALHHFMNENWDAIYQEFSAPVLEKPIEKIYTAIKTYLHSQPLADIANV